MGRNVLVRQIDDVIYCLFNSYLKSKCFICSVLDTLSILKLMRNLLFIALSFGYCLLQANDNIYTVTATIDDEQTYLDSILIENLSNNTNLCFNDLPELTSYRLNLSTQELEIESGFTSTTQQSSFEVIKNVPGEINIKLPTDIPFLDVLVYNIDGKIMQSRSYSNSMNFNMLQIQIPYAGIYIVAIKTPGKIQSFKAIGDSYTSALYTNIQLYCSSNTSDLEQSGLLKEADNTSSDFSYLVNDSLRVSVFRTGYYAYPLQVVFDGDETLDYPLSISNVENYGISELYKDISSQDYQVVSFDTLTGTTMISFASLPADPVLYVGDYIAIDYGTFGLLQKIVAIQIDEAESFVSSEIASVDEVFVNAAFEISTDLYYPNTELSSTSTNDEIINALTDAEGFIHPVKANFFNLSGEAVSYNVLQLETADDTAAAIIDFYNSFNQNEIYGEEDGTVHLLIDSGYVAYNSEALLNFKFSVIDSLTNDTKLKEGELEHFKSTWYTNSVINSYFSLDAGKASVEGEINKLVENKSVSACFMIPPGIPLWVFFEYGVNTENTIVSEDTLSTVYGFFNRNNITSGFTYEKNTDNYTAQQSFIYDNNLLKIEIDGEKEALVQCAIKPQVNVKVNYLPGPFFENNIFSDIDLLSDSISVDEDNNNKFATWNATMNMKSDFETGTNLSFAGLNKETWSDSSNILNTQLWNSPNSLENLTEIPDSINSGDSLNVTLKVTDSFNEPVKNAVVYVNGDGTSSYQLLKTDADGLVSLKWYSVNLGGHYTFTACIYNANGTICDKLQKTIYIAIENPELLPIAGFMADSTNLKVLPATVNFANSSVNATSYLWDFGNDVTSTEVNPTVTYNHSGEYLVSLKAINEYGNDTALLRITVLNQAPSVPKLVSPSNEETLDGVSADLTWSCTDPDGDNLSYNIYFDGSDGSTLVSSGQTDTIWSTGTLGYNTTYFWKIEVDDGNGYEISSDVWSFSTAANQAPATPSLLSPADEDTLDAYSAELAWSCTDPENDDLTYNVYFDNSNASTLVSENQSATSWSTGDLTLNTSYFWKVVAKDSYGNQTTGDVSSFTTIADTSTPEPPEYQLTIKYPGVSSVGMDAIFIAWAEDADSNNIQNLYICNKIKKDIVTSASTLYGEALPYWRREKSASIDWDDVDGITGASTQTAFEITRTLSVGEVTEIRVCFEIDRSANGNEYFTDRPCFIYLSELIDLTALKDSYELVLRGFMANDSESNTYGQTPPLQDIPGFEEWKYMSDTSYITPRDMFIDESIGHSNLSVVIEKL